MMSHRWFRQFDSNAMLRCELVDRSAHAGKEER